MLEGKIGQRISDGIAKNKSEVNISGRFQNDSNRGRITDTARAAVTKAEAVDANAKVLAAAEALRALQDGVLEAADPDVRRQLGLMIAGLDRQSYSHQWVVYGHKSK